ncbi:hypothetical protein JOE63_000933 [Cellulosimicrobium cellulans]|jgi:hypothetical protein|uniref:hypothetical protein n=1 Tax=Cellulosimicrobium cellulans TaxID=1710 RepID=UPI00195B36B5|nr:hypothetical protein [Cellulosimicrobium cellulans]MBM7818456.1 hypothetical protein [Cellulosimicrobium cellulans]
MRIARGRAVGAAVVAGVVAAGVVLLWTAPEGDDGPRGVAEVHVVGDDAPGPPAERPRVVQVEPDEDVLSPLPSRAALDAQTGEPIDLADHVVGGYEGWWSSDGNGEACDAYADAHPEVVLASTRTGEVLEAHTNGARLQRPPQTPPGDPAEWPADSVVVLDARTGEVLDAFAVDESGWRLELPVDCVPPSETH